MLIIKALIGAMVVVLMSFAAKSKNYYIVGLIPLFPTFAIIGQIIIYSERSTEEFKSVVLFGMLALIPYFIYLLTLYFVIDHLNLTYSLIISVIFWLISAYLLIYIWNV